MAESRFRVPALDCPSEAAVIRSKLEPIQGVSALKFDYLEREVAIEHELADASVLEEALVAIGMPPEKQVSGTGCVSAGGAHRPALPWVVLGISGACAVAAETVSFVLHTERSPVVGVLAAASLALGGRDTLRKGWTALRTMTLNISFLMSVAVIGAITIGEWPEAAMVTFLFALAERIEAHSLDRARNAIRGLMELAPETAEVRDEAGGWREVPAADVDPGQTVRVRPGERIPLDGRLTAGRSSVNQSPITGESMPVEKGVGDPVFAGTINERGSFEFEVTANKGNTTLDRIVRAVQEAQADRAPTQRFVDQFARYYTPVVFLIALQVAGLPPLLFGQPFVPWLYKALVLLVIACPCALVISTPVTVVSGLAAAARRGILVKGGVYLENGRKLRIVALDKTGTLTVGKPVVTDVEPLNGTRREDALHWAASLNAQSEHPVAEAIVTSCSRAHGERQCNLHRIADFEAILGKGVQGTLNGEKHYVGSHRLAHEGQRCSPEAEVILDRLEKDGKTTVVLTDSKKPLAVLGVADTLRGTSIEAIRELHDLGVRTVMLTGDNQTTATAIARKVGIDDARGNLLPEDKLNAIGELVGSYGNVGMVGDGINDAPALAKASIGFAMGAAGTDTALETADVALMQDDLRKLPEFIRLSRQTGGVLTQNITIALVIKVVFFGLALTGKATLWMAVFADMGASLLVVFNGLGLLNGCRVRAIRR